MTWTMKIGNRMMRKTLLSSDFQFIGAIEAFVVCGLEKYRDGQPGLRNCMPGQQQAASPRTLTERGVSPVSLPMFEEMAKIATPDHHIRRQLPASAKRTNHDGLDGFYTRFHVMM